MMETEYRAIHAINQSTLKAMLLSPAHYRFCLDHSEERSTPALRLGRAVHCRILTPQL